SGVTSDSQSNQAPQPQADPQLQASLKTQVNTEPEAKQPASAKDVRALRAMYDEARKAVKQHKRMKKQYRARGQYAEWKDELRSLRSLEKAAKNAYRNAK
ncbi:MAG: hypothetical protein AAFY56_21185, partial [Pseudomonadota bacterium]